MNPSNNNRKYATIPIEQTLLDNTLLPLDIIKYCIEPYITPDQQYWREKFSKEIVPLMWRTMICRVCDIELAYRVYTRPNFLQNFMPNFLQKIQPNFLHNFMQDQINRPNFLQNFMQDQINRPNFLQNQLDLPCPLKDPLVPWEHFDQVLQWIKDRRQEEKKGFLKKCLRILKGKYVGEVYWVSNVIVLRLNKSTLQREYYENPKSIRCVIEDTIQM